MNNYFPSIQSLYASFAIPESIKGTYSIKEFPVQAIVTERDDMLYLRITGSAISGFLIPRSEGSYETIDGSIKIQFHKEDGQYTRLSLQAPSAGVSATGQKASS
ncbi:MAG: hypothetical protein R3330_06385, partial [Saprospiraceae bacterium]|nr:hypothetical protein [Saprospiraceae bacterium]